MLKQGNALSDSIFQIFGDGLGDAKTNCRIEGDDEAASNYSAIALDCPNEKILECVNEFREMLSKKIRSKM